MERTQIGTQTLYCGRAEAILPTLPDASVQLILVDPPYMGVKAEAWDRQWKTRKDYLGWLKNIAVEWRRILKPAGSLYCFASPQMAAWVEVTLSETFHVLQRITWRKPPFSTKAEMFDKDTCRIFFPASEAIIFAEQYGSDGTYDDALITENASYWTACEQLKGRIFGEYLKTELTRACVTQKEIATLFPSASGGLTGCVSNWLLGYNCPTPKQYQAMRHYLNARNGTHDYLRREYEDLRREYEDLRRPFSVSADVPFTDVWDWPTVGTYPGKHPCEKPLSLLRHMISVSSRPNDTILDCFMGSGSTLEAAKQCGRLGIGIEEDPHWVQRGCTRLSQTDLFTAVPTPAKAAPPTQQAFAYAKGR